MTDDERIAQFEKRRADLRKLSDEQLKSRFWELCTQVMDPIVDLARTHTSPSIERSVLLRMGVDSVSSHGGTASTRPGFWAKAPVTWCSSSPKRPAKPCARPPPSSRIRKSSRACSRTQRDEPMTMPPLDPK